MDKEYYMNKAKLKAKMDMLELEFEIAFDEEDRDKFIESLKQWTEANKAYRNFLKFYFETHQY